MDDFTALLRLVLQETGGNQNVWGFIQNASLIRLLDDAIAGREDVDVTLDDQTLMGQNGADDPARAAILIVSGNPGETREVIVPSTSKIYIVTNETSPAFDITIKTALGAGTVISGDTRALVIVDSTADDVFQISNPPQATEDVAGIAEIADQAEVDAGTDDERFVTPLKLATFPAVNQATEDVKGVAELADQAETDAGTDDLRIVTPLKLEGRAATESLTGLAAIADQAEVDAGVNDTKFITPAKLAATATGIFSGCSIFRTSHFIVGHTAGNAAGQVPTGIGIPSDNGEQPCPFDAEMIDTGLAQFGTEFHSTSVQTTRITIPAGVNFVRLSGSAIWDQICPLALAGETCDPSNSVTGLQHMRIRKNGNSFASFTPDATNVRGTGTQYQPWTTTVPNAQESGHEVQSVVVPVEEDDYFELTIFTQGSNESGHRVRSGAVFEMEVMG